MQTTTTTLDALGRMPAYPDRGPCVEVRYRPADEDDVPLRYARAFEGSLWGAAILGPITAGIFALLPAALGVPGSTPIALGTGLVVGTLMGVMTGGIAGSAEVDRRKIARDHGRAAVHAGTC